MKIWDLDNVLLQFGDGHRTRLIAYEHPTVFVRALDNRSRLSRRVNLQDLIILSIILDDLVSTLNGEEDDVEC